MDRVRGGADVTPQPDRDDHGVPWCIAPNCQAWDGKRCKLLGHRAPDGDVCPPAVRELAAEVERLRAEADRQRLAIERLRLQADGYGVARG